MQTPEGILKMKQSMIERHGSEEAYKAYMRANASLGGKAKVPKGFAMFDEAKVKAAGAKGGRISRRYNKKI